MQFSVFYSDKGEYIVTPNNATWAMCIMELLPVGHPKAFYKLCFHIITFEQVGGSISDVELAMMYEETHKFYEPILPNARLVRKL